MSELINIFYIILLIFAVGGIFASAGYFKGKIQQHTKVIDNLASRDELAVAIQRSDEMLEIMKERAEEDRTKGQGQWRDFNEALKKHAERIGALETQQNSLIKTLDEIKSDQKNTFNYIQNQFKDIQNELKEIARNLRSGNAR